jgi:hypothetical protein
LELKLIKLMKRKLKIKPNKIFSEIYSTVDTRVASRFVFRNSIDTVNVQNSGYFLVHVTVL